MVRRDKTSGIGGDTSATGAPRTQRGILRKEGNFWSVSSGGNAFRLKDSKGLAYIEYLLRHPETDFHVLDLVARIANRTNPEDKARLVYGVTKSNQDLENAGMHVADLGDAGEQLDDQAKHEYRNRLNELLQELEEAKALGRVERGEQIEEEIETLTRELSRAVGLGGRNRRAASASERARQSVTKAIKSVVERIAESDSSLADFFSRCIKTGTFCCYKPDRNSPISLEIGSAPSEHGTAPLSDHELTHPYSDQAAIPGSRGFGPLSFAARTPFVGRESESAFIRLALEAKTNGSGSIVMVGGEPGVGKTRLVMEGAEYAGGNGFRYLVGHCYEKNTAVPYLPFVEIFEGHLAQCGSLEDFRRQMGGNLSEIAQIVPSLRRVFSNIPEPLELPPEQVQRYFFQGISQVLTRLAREQPYLLIIEDLHWADESTLALLSHLANLVGALPLLIIGTYRDRLSDDNPSLFALLEELIRLGIHPLELRRLPKVCVGKMLNELSHREIPETLVNAIFEESDGNPFFVEEIYRHLLEEGRIFDHAGRFRAEIESHRPEVPVGVRLVLRRRLARLSENSRQILTTAAAIGRNFSFTLLEAVFETKETDTLVAGLEEAQQTGFIRTNPQDPEDPLAFCHELVRQTLLAEMLQPREERLHLKIAQALEKVHSGRLEEHAAEIADHLLKSASLADSSQISYYLSLTGRSLLKAGALEDARLSLTAALGYRQTNVGRHAQTLADLASAERGLGDWNAAVDHLHESLGLYVGLGDYRSIGGIIFDMAEGFIWTGRFDDIAEIARTGLRQLHKDENLYRARLLPVSALIHGLRGELSSAFAEFDEALALPTVTPFVGRVLAYRSGCHLHFLQLREALEYGNKSIESTGIESTNARDSPWSQTLALGLVMRSLYQLGRIDEALTIGTKLEPLARAAGNLGTLSACLSLQAWAEFARAPNLANLKSRMRDVAKFDRDRRLSWCLVQSRTKLMEATFLTGDWETARSMAEEVRSSQPHSSIATLANGIMLRLAAYSGERDRVLELAERTGRHLPLIGQVSTDERWSLLMMMVESLAMIGERARAAEYYPLVAELLTYGPVCMLLTCRFPQTIAGIAASAAGHWQVADDHFGTALKQAITMPHRLEEAEVRRFYAMMLLDRAAEGGPEKARTLLIESLQSYSHIGMQRHADLTRDLLARAGG